MKLPQMKLFLKKLIELTMYLSVPFILQIFKKFFRVDPELWGCAIQGSKVAQLSWRKFFWYKPLLLLSSTYWPFSLYKMQEKFLYEDVPFLGPKWSIYPHFFWKIIKIIFIYLLVPFTVKHFKKFFYQIPSYQDVQFLGSKWPICPNEIFFQKTC